MINIVFIENGDILKTKYKYIVMPVNVFGSLGAGLAKKLAEWCPEVIAPYKALCTIGVLKIGSARALIHCDKVIVLFPTKKHWKYPSQLSYIRSGMKSLSSIVSKLPSKSSVAIPKLGCGLGGLYWEDVRDIILDEVKQWTKYKSISKIEIYGSEGLNAPSNPGMRR